MTRSERELSFCCRISKSVTTGWADLYATPSRQTDTTFAPLKVVQAVSEGAFEFHVIGSVSSAPAMSSAHNPRCSHQFSPVAHCHS